MATRKRAPSSKKTSAKKTASKKAAAKKPPAKKAAGKTAGKKAAAAKGSSPEKAAPRKKAAARPAAAKASEAAPAAPASGAKKSAAGGTTSLDVHLGHVMALRPRVPRSFRPQDFQAARHQLQDERYADVPTAARAVVEKALELTREAGAKRGRQKRR